MKSVKFNIEVGERIIAISDIHGHGQLFGEMIEKLHLKDRDHLIIIGDFVDKGIDSYDAFRRVEAISHRKNTIVLKGNHELFMHYLLTDANHMENNDGFMQSEPYETVIHAALRSHDKSVDSFENYKVMMDYFDEHFSELVTFLSDRPIIAETDDFIFVHGGYDDEFSLENDEHKFLKYDDYYNKGKVNKKNVVVGHWPTSVLRTDKISNRPFYHEEKKIFFIDGGLGVKDCGEMNAFIIEKQIDGYVYQTVQHHHFHPHTVISENDLVKEEVHFINYPHFDIEVINKGNHTTKVRHVHSQKELTVFNDLLDFDEEMAYLKSTYANNFIKAEKGEMVDLCKVYGDVALVKHKSEYGWMYLNQLERVKV